MLQVGRAIRDAPLCDASGVTRPLSALTGTRGLVLVLYRGHW